MPREVAIVGAGIVGLAIAHHCLAEGWRVRLIERGGVAEGASFGNAGALAFTDVLPLASPGILRKAPRWVLDPLGPLALPPAYLPRIAPWLLRFWRASLPDRHRHATEVQCGLMRLAAPAMEAMVASAGLAGRLRRDGNLELYESEAELSASEPGWAARAREGIAFEHVRGTRLAELQPGLSPRFVAGTFTPNWMTVDDPHRFALALHADVMAKGATLVRGEVRDIAPEGGAVNVALADGTALRTDACVLAAGAWSRALARRLGDRVPLDTERGYNTTLPPGAFDLRRQLTFGGHGFVVTPLATGLRVGGAVEFGGLRRPPNFARADAMLRKAAAFLPGLRIEGGRQWMGFRPSLPDSLPVIGPSRASPRILYAFGHGHLGLTQSAATGRIVADLLAGRGPGVDVAALRAGRFG
ncbi:FAD-dependent oxidoreductase [Methylobacterium sp. 17Sr1-1]|uniref:NAD(P)/FAD-dependent oxidoreductase n=1 Tax=Methylobacterium sp. 17Sr1-1 TaxID=2202826 RepID=UPI000D6F9748|nr:FAD-dependent oxidoreductase [Methylobacterium sp. 17Sr1-1]AWN51439.1 amino acid dehydrogenase [Methylobacterium sp. 17Sr1-1]